MTTVVAILGCLLVMEVFLMTANVGRLAAAIEEQNKHYGIPAPAAKEEPPDGN